MLLLWYLDITNIVPRFQVRMGLVPPVEIRAETYKQEIREAESIKYKLENKEHDIKDLRRVLKEKNEELLMQVP